MGVRVLEVECDADHCADQDCKCKPLETITILSRQDINDLWRWTGPEDERYVLGGWERTDVEPWKSLTVKVLANEGIADGLARKLAETV